MSWRAHRTIRLGASLAYYGLFAVVPLFSISLAVAGVLIDPADVAEAISSLLGGLVDTDSTELSDELSRLLEGAPTISGLGIVGVVSLLVTSSLVFVALQDAFDTIWEVPVARGTWATVRRRMLAFAVVLLTGAVLIASFAVSAVSGLIRNLAPGDAPILEVAADLLAASGSWALLALVFASLFRFLTMENPGWRVTAIGGLTTALALTIGNRLFVEYMRTFGASSIVGATGSLLVGLVWIYAIAQIILAGAEFTRTLHRRRDAAA